MCGAPSGVGGTATNSAHQTSRVLHICADAIAARYPDARYCNARSFVPWDDDAALPTGASANRRHILARGSKHMPHARPRFGTAVELD